jgi:hypothetical protein
VQKVMLAMLGLGALLAGAPASAQTYGGGFPVCLQTYGRFSHIDCSYASIGQCRASAAGRAAQCITNPYFAGHAGAPGRRHKYRAY